MDGDDHNNYAPNAVAGFNVNSIAIEVPITMLTSDGAMHPASDAAAVIGSWATTSRQKINVLGAAGPRRRGRKCSAWATRSSTRPIIGTGAKDRFSMDEPIQRRPVRQLRSESAGAAVLRISAYRFLPAPRTDLLPLVQYMAPICPGCTFEG